MNTVERLMARRQVVALIKADPVMITPIRKAKVPNSSGGWKWTLPTPMLPIEVLILPAKRRLSEMLVNTELGHLTLYPYIILARHTADLKRDDTFTWEGQEFEVKSLALKTQVSITAQIDHHGEADHG